MKNEFKKFNISDEILKAIEGLGYKKPSEVKAMIRENNCTDIDQPIIHAIFDVKANPPHKKS